MSQKRKVLNSVYERDKTSRAYIIKIKIDRYKDLFNDMDPSPFRNRDLDADFLSFVDNASLDIPLKYPVALQILVPEEIRDVERESRVIAGMRVYYNLLLNSVNRRIAGNLRNFVFYILVSLGLLFTAFYLGSTLPKNFLWKTFNEGFYIGGWVFLWEALVLLSFKTRELQEESRRLKRTANAAIDFRYQDG